MKKKFEKIKKDIFEEIKKSFNIQNEYIKENFENKMKAANNTKYCLAEQIENTCQWAVTKNFVGFVFNQFNPDSGDKVKEQMEENVAKLKQLTYEYLAKHFGNLFKKTKK